MVYKIEEMIPLRNINLDKWSFFLKRVIYICCFAGLCIIDQVIGSATGYIQYGLKNYTGIIIAIIILTSYNAKDFLNPIYSLWIISYFVLRYICLEQLNIKGDNYLELNTNIWGIGIYGLVFIRMIYCWIVEKKKPRINWIPFGLCMFMLVCMAVIRSDYAWPKVLLITFLCFYLTEFKEKDLNNLYSGMVEGIIVGFFIIQVQAWLYRPYDRVRYDGMYSHANMNALLYICSYSAVLCKWYLMKLKKTQVIFRIPLVFLSGLIGGTMFFTGSRSAAVTWVVVVLIFMIFHMLSRTKRRLIGFFISGLIIVTSILICIIPAYWLIRYVPAWINEPLFFEADSMRVEGEKVQKGDPINSEKYIELNEATKELLARYLGFINLDKIEMWLGDFQESADLSLEVYAAELNTNIEQLEEVEPGSDSLHPMYFPVGEDARPYIYKYFLNKLTLIGKKNNVQGVWLSPTYLASHCHNIFLQIAYDFGIIVGIIFIIVVLMMYIKLFLGLLYERGGTSYYRLLVAGSYTTILIVFGMFELCWIYGQLPFTMFFIVQYIVYHKVPKRLSAKSIRIA